MKLEGRESELQRLSDGLDRAVVGLVLGFAGMGKTALAATLADRWPGPVLFAQPADHKTLWEQLPPALRGLDSAVGDAMAKLGDRRFVAQRDRLGELLTGVLEEHGALLWIDGMQRLDEAEQAWLLRDFAAQLRQGRLLVTSRRRPPVDLSAPPRVEVLLGPLDEAAAAALWQELDLLHGSVPGFAQAYVIAGGVPLALRSVHAGGNATSIELDPVLAMTNALQGDELTVVRALAVAAAPIPLRTLRRVLPEARERAALDGLRHRLVVDIDAGRQVTLAPRFAESVLRWMHPEELAQTHRTLAELFSTEPKPDSDAPLRTAHHLLGAGDEQAAGALLAQALPACVQAGLLQPCGELLDRVAPANRTLAVERARGACYSLGGQPETGYAILRRLADADPPTHPELAVDLALCALLTARFDEAEGLLASPVSAPADGTLSLDRECLLALVWTLRGRVTEAQQHLTTLSGAASDIQAYGQVLWTRAFARWLCGDDALAERVLRESPEAVGGFLNWSILPGVLGSLSPVYARLGRFEEAERHVRAPVRLVDQQSLVAPLEQAVLLDARGHREEAFRAFQGAVANYQRKQLVLHASWARIQLGRALMVQGQVATGQEILNHVGEEAAAAGAPILQAMAEAQQTLAPAVHFGRGPTTGAPLDEGMRLREQAFAALRAVVTTRQRWDQPTVGLPEAEALIREVSDRPGYGVERLVLALVDAYALRLSGHVAQARAALDGVVEQAHAASIDTEVIEALIAAAGRFFAVDGEGVRGVRATCEPTAAGAVWLDRTQHTLTMGDAVQVLANRPVMRRLLYGMARRLPAPVDKSTLVAEAWQEAYNPAQHDNPLRVNIGRLRKAVASFGLALESGPDGYRLRAPVGFCFIEPVFDAGGVGP